jgi:hypothetical protein
MAKGFSPFGGKETKKEEAKEKKLPPWLYKKGEKSEGEKMACGGKVKKHAAGGAVRGTGAATKGKAFCGTF